jgi:hypothetical protein
MLKSVLHNPKVFIVCRDGRNKDYVKNLFGDMVYEVNRESMRTMGISSTELYLEWPKFITMDRVSESIRGYDHFIPVIFDNSCYYD